MADGLRRARAARGELPERDAVLARGKRIELVGRGGRRLRESHFAVTVRAGSGDEDVRRKAQPCRGLADGVDRRLVDDDDPWACVLEVIRIVLRRKERVDL